VRRYLALFLVLALGAALFAPTALAGKKKKKKPKPVPVEAVYYINWGGEECVLQSAPVPSEDACADPFAGLAGSTLGHGPWAMAVTDGLPLTLDASKPIKGVISASSYYLQGVGPDVMGIGQAQLDVKLAGTSGGEEIVIGELTTDPYTVTPAEADYTVEFEITPPEELAGKVFESLVLSLELTGNQMFHGVLNADGTSTVTIGAFALP
jgi:hypothetical protein